MTTAPLYYMRFVLGDSDPFYQNWVIPFAFGLPLLVFIAEAMAKRQTPRAALD